MYSLQVRLNNELIFRFDSIELQEIIEEVIAWATDYRAEYVIIIQTISTSNGESYEQKTT